MFLKDNMDYFTKARHVRAFQSANTAIVCLETAIEDAKRTLNDAAPDQNGELRADKSITDVMRTLVWGYANAMANIETAFANINDAHEMEILNIKEKQ